MKQPQPLQCVRGKAGTVALVADDHDPPGSVAGGRDAVRAGGIEPPFKNVPVNDHRSRKLTITVPLLHRPCVNDEGAVFDLPLQIRGVDPLQPDAALSQ